MSRPPWKGPARKPWLIITKSTPHNVALVRGKDAYRVCCDLSPLDVPPVRSAAGGWIVSLDVAEDIRLYGRHLGELVVVHERKADR